MRQYRNMRESRDKQAQKNTKHSNKNVIIAASAIAAIVVITGIGSGYAYASNSAYGSYESRVESAKEVDSKLAKKIAEARTLVKATKEADVLDKTVLDALTKSIKTGEALKGVPATSHATKWNLWGTSKAKASVVDDIAKADDSIDAIGKAISKVEASKTAKQVKDAKDTLNKTISDAETLYKDSEGKVQDEYSRALLRASIDKRDEKAITDAMDKVNASIDAKNKDDEERKAQEEAAAAAAQAQEQSTPAPQQYSYTPSGSASGSGSGPSGGGYHSSGGSAGSTGGSASPGWSVPANPDPSQLPGTDPSL